MGAVSGVLCFIGILLFVAWTEPFAQRHDGRTVRQWVKYYAANPQVKVESTLAVSFQGREDLIDLGVIEAFGTNALKTLLAECELSMIGVLILETEAYEVWPYLQPRSESENRRDGIARLWLRQWICRSTNQVADFLVTNSDHGFQLWVFQQGADPLTGITFLRTYTMHPNEYVRGRAKRLLKELEGENAIEE